MLRFTLAFLAAFVLTITLPAHGATVTFTAGGPGCAYEALSFDGSGNLRIRCASGSAPIAPQPTPQPPAPTPPAPTPPPAPVPPVAGTCPAIEGNLVIQTMYAGGTNNYALDSLSYRNPPPGTQANGFPEATTPHNTVQVFPLPRTWPDGAAITAAQLTFTDYIYFNLAGAQYEASFSPCKGDFTSYKSSQVYNIPYAGTFTPCGGLIGSSATMRWSTEGNFLICQIPANEQWYLNWRVVPGTCKTGFGHTCGQTFYVPRG